MFAQKFLDNIPEIQICLLKESSAFFVLKIETEQMLTNY